MRLDSLPRQYRCSSEAKHAPEPKEGEAARAAGGEKTAPGDAGSVLTLIEQLSALKEKGILTEEEFAAKKTELLKRL